MEREIFSHKRKTLTINLDQTIFGTIAEIGGGQEVARSFFQAGAASGTVAKTISAYDKSFSDFLYNNSKSGRYVSEARLVKMLDKEFEELVVLQNGKRKPETCFFTFADTVSILNYHKDNECHGWIGVKFQLKPGSEPNEVAVHIRLLENDAPLQQYTLGIFGVNLIYACYYFSDRPNVFLQSLLDNLSTDRLEVDMVRMKGPELEYVDNRLLAVQLVKNGMTSISMFDRNGKVQQPADMLYKKNVMILRGSFRPITYVGFDMLKSGFALFKKDVGFDKENTVVLCEMTMNNLLDHGTFDERDFLDRADILCGMGQDVIITNFREFYKLTDGMKLFHITNLRMIVGAPTLQIIFDPEYYTNLHGGLLEAMGRLFVSNLKIYVYPALQKNPRKLIRSGDIRKNPRHKLLFSYLKETGYIIDIPEVNEDRLHIFSHSVLEMIKQGKKSWEQFIPKSVVKQIKQKRLFGYNPS